MLSLLIIYVDLFQNGLNDCSMIRMVLFMAAIIQSCNNQGILKQRNNHLPIKGHMCSIEIYSVPVSQLSKPWAVIFVQRVASTEFNHSDFGTSQMLDSPCTIPNTQSLADLHRSPRDKFTSQGCFSGPTINIHLDLFWHGPQCTRNVENDWCAYSRLNCLIRSYRDWWTKRNVRNTLTSITNEISYYTTEIKSL